MFDVARDLLAHEIDGTRFRLIGIGLSNLSPGSSAEDGDLLDRRSANAERAMDSLKEKFGDEAIMRGLAFRPPRGRKDKPT